MAPADHVVWLDLRSRELRLFRWPQLPSVGDSLLLASGEQHVCPVEGVSTSALFVVQALVDGREAQLAVDTGALRTDLMAGAAAALPLLGRSVEADASYTAGGTVRSRRVADVTVAVGGITRTLELGVIPGQPLGGCRRDGHLALDVLRGCAMALSPWRFAAWCDR